MVATVNRVWSEGRDGVVEVIEDLQRELEDGRVWENDTLLRYLDGLGALLGSIENAYVNAGTDVPDDPWTLIAEALRGARHYE